MRALAVLLLLTALPALLLTALPAAAESWRCAGDDPGWTLRIDGARAEFVFPAPTQMEVMQQSRAEMRDWPLAMTLIGERDTAIVLLEPLACAVAQGAQPYRALVLTQRGQTPILLAGCCEAPE